MTLGDEKSLCDEEADDLLSKPALSAGRGFECRDLRRDHQIVWLFIAVVGSVLLNVLLVVLLLSVKYKIQEQQKSPYGQ